MQNQQTQRTNCTNFTSAKYFKVVQLQIFSGTLVTILQEFNYGILYR